jgi:hypothetical protein
MAVGTQDLKRFDSIIERVAVDVVKLETDRLAPPVAEATSLATRVLETGLDKA